MENAEKLLHGKNVLVVEDSKLIRRMLVSQLKALGMNVEEAEHGQEGLEKLDGLDINKLAVILTDILMPVMDGASFVKAAKEKYKDQLPPVLVCTTDTDKETVQVFAILGVKGYLLKPFKTEALVEKLCKVLVPHS